MNALTLLKQDHQNVEALFRRFEQAGEDDHQEKQRVASKVIEQLSTHAAVEELVLYPAVRRELPEETPLVLEALEEHHLVKLSLAELDRLRPQDERFTAKMTVLIESVRHHVEEEEEELFPKIREALSVQQLEELGEAMEKAKETAPTRPHPRQPDQPPLNALLSVPVAVLDRVIKTGRDAVGKALSRR